MFMGTDVQRVLGSAGKSGEVGSRGLEDWTHDF